MSKLDKIQTMCEFCDNAPALDEICKERIKALMLDVYREAENSEFDTRGEFFQKVEEL